MDFFFSPTAKMWKKIEIVSAGFGGVFPLKEKYLEELLFTFERAHVCSFVFWMHGSVH